MPNSSGALTEEKGGTMKSHQIFGVALGLSIFAFASSSTAAVYAPSARANVLESTIIEPAQWGHRGFYARPYAVRPYWGYRPWWRRPYYGSIVAGVALGTIITVAAVGLVPRRPAPDLCWYWANPNRDRGYWDYCY
jgi:hypothetical protein